MQLSVFNEVTTAAFRSVERNTALHKVIMEARGGPTHPHVAVLPSPGMGHFIPFAELSERLVLHHSFTVTFITSSDFLQRCPPCRQRSWRPVLRLLYRKLHVAVYHSSLSGPSRDHLVRGPGPAGTGGHTRVHPTQKCRPRRRDEESKQRSLPMGLRDCKLNEENGRHPRQQLCGS